MLRLWMLLADASAGGDACWLRNVKIFGITYVRGTFLYVSQNKDLAEMQIGAEKQGRKRVHLEIHCSHAWTSTYAS